MFFADNKSKSKNGNEQSTVYMINSLVMYGKQKTNDASFHLEQLDHEYAHKDVSYEEVKKPVKTIGYGEGDSYDALKACPEKGKSPVDDHEELVKESWQPRVSQ